MMVDLIASYPRGDNVSVGARKLAPALFTRPVSGPVTQISAIIFSMLSGSRTLATSASACPPDRLRISPTALSRTSCRRPQMKTCAPCAANPTDISLPRPVPPPVTRMRFPLRTSPLNMEGHILYFILARPLWPTGPRLNSHHRAQIDTLLYFICKSASCSPGSHCAHHNPV